MSKIDDGPAFPCGCTNAGKEEIPGFANDMVQPGHKTEYSGMTLRDYFAAKAMQGEVAACQSQRAKPDDVAEFAYRVADAMIRARTQEPSHENG